MKSKSIYLGGGITGLSFQEANDWREYSIKWLLRYGIKGISPLRDKQYLKDEKDLKHFYSAQVLSLPKSITCRDLYDVKNCDIILMNFSNAKIPSIGSCCELGYAKAFEKPVITITEDNQIHNHPFINEISSFTVKTLKQGLEICISILQPY